jgi:hypothetical protein
MASIESPRSVRSSLGAPEPALRSHYVRFKTDSMHGYKGAWLLWPASEVWPRDGEIDFPEATSTLRSGPSCTARRDHRLRSGLVLYVGALDRLAHSSDGVDPEFGALPPRWSGCRHLDIAYPQHACIG